MGLSLSTAHKACESNKMEFASFLPCSLDIDEDFRNLIAESVFEFPGKTSSFGIAAGSKLARCTRVVFGLDPACCLLIILLSSEGQGTACPIEWFGDGAFDKTRLASFTYLTSELEP
jgi:hypothetical protein